MGDTETYCHAPTLRREGKTAVPIELNSSTESIQRYLKNLNTHWTLWVQVQNWASFWPVITSEGLSGSKHNLATQSDRLHGHQCEASRLVRKESKVVSLLPHLGGDPQVSF